MSRLIAHNSHYVVSASGDKIGSSIFERKKKFVESIPAALAGLNGLLAAAGGCFPALCDVLARVAELPRFAPQKDTGLVVDVCSFSYHRGVPDDYSGNGGGFVFDCRAVHNPGRYEPYKKLTGMDEPVKKFLEEKSEIAAFLANASSLVDTMVEEYLRRGFRHIQICFGCTGGQHRSVYSAEYMAHRLSQKYGIKVNVDHKMQGVAYTLEAR